MNTGKKLEPIWEEPPNHSKSAHHRSKFGHIAEELRAHPNEWARISEPFKSASAVTQFTNGKAKTFPKGDFEGSTRKREDGKYDVYLRFVGKVDKNTEKDKHLSAA